MSINSDELDAIVSAARKMVDRLDGRAERFLGETFTDLKSAVENYSVGPFDLDSNEVKSRRETQTYRLIQEVDMFLHGLMEDDKYKNGAGELHVENP